MRTGALTFFLALAGSQLAQAKPACPGLDAAIKAKGKHHVGSALAVRDNAAEMAIIESQIGAVTPENSMKWESVHPARDQYTFNDADGQAAFAVDTGRDLRCHTLVWHSQLAPWVVAGNFDNATLISIMEDHINTVAGRYKGKCTHWDVVNEALNEDGTYRETVWYNTIGEAYIPIAFRFAALADPEAKLWYNDYNLEFGGAKVEGAQRIVELIKSYGGRIDGVGLQAHLVVEPTPTQGTITPSQEELEAVLYSFTDLDVDVEYTEIDIRMNTPSTPEKLQDQADAYEALVGSCMAVERCIGFTLWGISDLYSWIPYTFDGEGAALLWDEEFKKKPAYGSVLKAIHDA